MILWFNKSSPRRELCQESGWNPGGVGLVPWPAGNHTDTSLRIRHGLQQGTVPSVVCSVTLHCIVQLSYLSLYICVMMIGQTRETRDHYSKSWPESSWQGATSLPQWPHQAPVEISLDSQEGKGYFDSVFNLSLWNVLRTSHRLNFTSKYFRNIINISQHFPHSYALQLQLSQRAERPFLAVTWLTVMGQQASTCFRLFIFPPVSPV